MNAATNFHELMAADLEIHKKQVKLMRRHNRFMAGACIILAAIVVISILGGYWTISQIQAQNADMLEMIRGTTIMRL